VSKIVIGGGGMIGLIAGTMIARDGHDVTVLESDAHAAPTSPADAWASWERDGVAQFRQPHNLFTRFRAICDEEVPGLTDRLLASGCVWVDYLNDRSLPPAITDRTPRPGDAAMRFVTGRRPVVEMAVAQMAEQEPNLTVVRGAKVRELLTGPAAIAGVPHVVGVRTTDGDDIRADLVVDATGRRSRAPEWLAGIGARPPVDEVEDSNFFYYTRFFTGNRPVRYGGALIPMGTFSLLTLDGDNDTWSVTVFTTSRNKDLRGLRDAAAFQRLVGALPRHAHWLDGRAITDVLPMAGIMDRYRRFVVDGQPVVTGFAAVGDAWACTNPSAGRGLSVGTVHAQVLRNVVREHLDRPAVFATAYDDATERDVTPFFRNQINADRAREAEMVALLTDAALPPPNPTISRLMLAAINDADVFRAMIETVVCLALPQEVLARPYVAAKMAEYDGQAPPPDRGMPRERVLELIAG